MSVDVRPALPAALSQAIPRAGQRDRLMKGVATATAIFAATIAVVIVAMSAVVLGLT